MIAVVFFFFNFVRWKAKNRKANYQSELVDVCLTGLFLTVTERGIGRVLLRCCFPSSAPQEDLRKSASFIIKSRDLEAPSF